MSQMQIDRHGASVVVQLDVANAEHEITELMRAIGAREAKKGSKAAITVVEKNDQWLLHDEPARQEYRLTTTADLQYMLTDRIIYHLADNMQQATCLHAAAVAGEAGAIIVPAESGSGKSLFTAWLVKNGYHYITDELIFIDEANQVSGLSRPIQIKSHGLDAIRSLVTNESLINRGKLSSAVAISALEGSYCQSEQPLALVVFPKFECDQELSFQRLSAAQAGLRMMGSNINARNLEDHGFRRLVRAIKQTPCYQLKYGGFSQLDDGFISRLRKLSRGEDA